MKVTDVFVLGRRQGLRELFLAGLTGGVTAGPQQAIATMWNRFRSRPVEWGVRGKIRAQDDSSVQPDISSQNE
jgi:hypothetical protein